MLTTLIARSRSKLAAFSKETRGATAVLFALLAVPVFGIGMAAIDYGIALTSKNKFQDAADAATNAGAKLLGQPHDVIEAAVRAYLKANLPSDHKEVEFALTFTSDDKSLSVKINDTVPTTILGIVGVKAINVAVESTATRPDPIPELGGPSHGIAPELPPELARSLGQGRTPTPNELRQAEEQAKQILESLEKSDSSGDVRRLLEILKSQQ